MKRLLILFLLLAVGCNNRQQADNANQIPENNALPWQNVSDSLGSGYDKSNINVYVNTEHPGVSVSKIYYKSTDGSIIQPNDKALFDARIVSNTYEDGVGVICFDGPITVIHSEAFYNKDVLSSIIIPNSVTSIGSRAFFWCDNLTSIIIPNSVTSIGSRAFLNCENLTNVTIGSSVTEIGDWAFCGCYNLEHFYGKFATSDGKALICNGKLISYACGNYTKSYNIPNSVTQIGGGAFHDCDNLTSITIPNSVTYIGNEAFKDCTNLTSVTISDSITTIGSQAFMSCISLKEFKGEFASADGRCLIIDGTLNSFAPYGLTEYIIPDSATSIGNSAFSGCDNLTSIIIPNSVTSIGELAFYGCENLTSITIPNSVTSIGERPFKGCENLKEVYCKATTPPDALYEMDCLGAFGNNALGRKIYVPRESVEAYKSAGGWKNYASAIVGYDF